MLRIRDTWESEKIGRRACECVLGIDDLQRPAISFHGIPLNSRIHCVIYEQYIIPCSGRLCIHQFMAARSMIDLHYCLSGGARKSDEEYTRQANFENDYIAQGSDVKQTGS
jgi:hypothetical protein